MHMSDLLHKDTNIISSLIKFIQKILIFVSPNRFSIKIYYIINLIIFIL
jgi:hypothetical protein